MNFITFPTGMYVYSGLRTSLMKRGDSTKVQLGRSWRENGLNVEIDVQRVYAKHVETIFQLSNLQRVKYIEVDITPHDVSLSTKGKSRKNDKNCNPPVSRVS